jgi:hypothetical protein
MVTASTCLFTLTLSEGEPHQRIVCAIAKLRGNNGKRKEAHLAVGLVRSQDGKSFLTWFRNRYFILLLIIKGFSFCC